MDIEVVNNTSLSIYSSHTRACNKSHRIENPHVISVKCRVGVKLGDLMYSYAGGLKQERAMGEPVHNGVSRILEEYDMGGLGSNSVDIP